MTPPMLMLSCLPLALAVASAAPDAGPPDPAASDQAEPGEHRPEPADPEPEPGPEPEPESEPESDEQPDASESSTDTPTISMPPSEKALEHLTRAQALANAGDLDSAEAEVSVAIALAPEDPGPYLSRAQIRMALAEEQTGDTLTVRRTRAALLRDAADDVEAYVQRAQLAEDGAAWYRARQDSLRRDADALDPPTPIEPEPKPPVPEPPKPKVTPVTEQPGDVDHRRRSRGLWSSGIALSLGAVGLSAASLTIHRSCERDDGLCSVRWKTRPSTLAPSIALAALGTTSIVLGLLDSPGLDKPRTRRAVAATTLALGGAATVVGTVTAGIVRTRWFGPVSPSDVPSLSSIQSIGNTSAAAFATALPLLSAGLTAALSHRRKRDRGTALARR